MNSTPFSIASLHEAKLDAKDDFRAHCTLWRKQWRCHFWAHREALTKSGLRGFNLQRGPRSHRYYNQKIVLCTRRFFRQPSFEALFGISRRWSTKSAVLWDRVVASGPVRGLA